MSITADLIRGHTETIILAQLLLQDSYGYEINKSVRQLSGGTYELKEATLYTVFRRLEDTGLISSYWGQENSGARRRYYRITPAGRDAYFQMKQAWEQTRAMIDALIREDEEHA